MSEDIKNALRSAIETKSNEFYILTLETRFFDSNAREDIFFQRNKLMIFDLEEEIQRYKFFTRYYDAKRNAIIRAKEKPTESDLNVILRSVRIVHGLYESTEDLLNFFSRGLSIGSLPNTCDSEDEYMRHHAEFYLFALISRMCFLVDSLEFNAQEMLLDFNYVKKHHNPQEELRYDGRTRNVKKVIKFAVGLTSSSDLLFHTYLIFRDFALEVSIPDILYCIFMKYLSFFRGRRVLSIGDTLWEDLLEFINSPVRTSFLPLCVEKFRSSSASLGNWSHFENLFLRSLKDLEFINAKPRNQLNLNFYDIESLLYSVIMMGHLRNGKLSGNYKLLHFKELLTYFLSDSYFIEYPELKPFK